VNANSQPAAQPTPIPLKKAFAALPPAKQVAAEPAQALLLSQRHLLLSQRHLLLSKRTCC